MQFGLALVLAALSLTTPFAAAAQGKNESKEGTPVPGAIDFGTDSSQWANDGECDDRRFFGPGTSMDSGFLGEGIGGDATDCRSLFEAGRIRLWVEAEARAATQCAAIDFGDDSSEWANDGECDDIRFEGEGTAIDLVPEDTGRDGSDCRAACTDGSVFLRDY